MNPDKFDWQRPRIYRPNGTRPSGCVATPAAVATTEARAYARYQYSGSYPSSPESPPESGSFS